MRLALTIALLTLSPLAGAERVGSCDGLAGVACDLAADPPVPSEIEVPEVPRPGIAGVPPVSVPPLVPSEPPEPSLPVHACSLAPRELPHAAPLVEARLAALGFAPLGDALGRSLRDLATPRELCHENVG